MEAQARSIKNQFPLLQDLDDLLILHLHRLPALFTQVFLHGFRPAILLGASTESAEAFQGGHPPKMDGGCFRENIPKRMMKSRFNSV